MNPLLQHCLLIFRLDNTPRLYKGFTNSLTSHCHSLCTESRSVEFLNFNNPSLNFVSTSYTCQITTLGLPHIYSSRDIVKFEKIIESGSKLWWHLWYWPVLKHFRSSYSWTCSSFFFLSRTRWSLSSLPTGITLRYKSQPNLPLIRWAASDSSVYEHWSVFLSKILCNKNQFCAQPRFLDVIIIIKLSNWFWATQRHVAIPNPRPSQSRGMTSLSRKRSVVQAGGCKMTI